MEWLFMSSKKGFVFTVDAFVALTLVVLVIAVVVYQLNIPSAFFPQQSQTYNYARDVVSPLSTLTIGELKANGQAPNAMSQYSTSTLEDDHTVLEQIAKEAAVNSVQAQLIAQELLAYDAVQLQPFIPKQFGAKISIDGTDIIIRDKPFTKIQSSASYVIVGYAQSKNPGTSPYDYPPENGLTPDKYVCSDGDPDTLSVPCDVFLDTTRYTPGVILGPSRVTVSIWT